MNTEGTQRKPPQVAKTTTQTTDDHLMPGLVQPLVDAFRRPRRHLTTRGVSRAKQVSLTAVHTALFRDIYEHIDELRGLLGRRPVASEVTVREYQQIRKVA